MSKAVNLSTIVIERLDSMRAASGRSYDAELRVLLGLEPVAKRQAKAKASPRQPKYPFAAMSVGERQFVAYTFANEESDEPLNYDHVRQAVMYVERTQGKEFKREFEIHNGKPGCLVTRVS